MKKLFSVFLLFAIAFSLKAQMGETLPIDPDVRYGKLENGLTYYIRHNAYPEKRADFYIAQKVGSMQEDDSQMGLAHFLEHMAFNGSKNYPGRKGMLDYLEKNGAKFGVNVNAYTSFDETVYNLSDIPVNRAGVVDSCLLILHDWSSFITLDNAEIDKERAIIKEEWRTRGNANWRYWEKSLPTLFAGSKYANRMPIGTMEVVENFDYQTLKDYYHKWYRPDLQAIIVVGDVDADAVVAKLKAMFADVPAPVNAAVREYFPVLDNAEPIVSIVTDAEATSTRVTLYHKHDVLPEDVKKTQAGYMASIVKNMASSMLSARLNEIAQKGDAPFAAAYAYDGNYLVAKTKDAWTALAISKEGKIAETLAVLVIENERIKQFGFTESEVERAKAELLKQYENAYNNRSKTLNENYINEYVSAFTDNDPIPGITYEYNMLKQIAPMISAQMVNAFVQQMNLIGDSNAAISIFGPEKVEVPYPSAEELLAVFNKAKVEKIEAYAETLSNEPLIATQPTAGKVVKEEKDAKLDATVWTLSNGMKVVLKKTDFKDDEIVMSSIAYGGKSLIPDADIPNTEFITAVPHIGGIGNFSATDLRKVLAGKTAGLNPDITQTTQGFKGNSSIKDFETLLQLTYLYFTAPRKDVESYTSLMEMVKNQLKNASTDPNTVFSDSVTTGLYGNNVRMKNLNYADVDKLNYDRIIELYKTLFANPGSYVFTFVGNVDEATMKPLVELYLASLPSGNKNAKYEVRDANYRKGVYANTFEQEMKTPKTSVFNLFDGTFAYNQKNRLTLDALKQILDIVYVQTVREDEGGTYGVGVGASLKRVPAGQTALMMQYDTDPEKAARISPIIERELKKIADEGPSAVDFQKVKEYMNKKFQEDVKTNNYWSGILSTYSFYSDDDYNNYLTILNALTANDVKEFTKALLAKGGKIEVMMNPKK